MKKKVFIQNIITPYRSHLFNVISEKDDSYEVFYMSKSEADRSWDLSKINMQHQYWLDKWGCYFMLGHFHIHLNPVLVTKAAFSRGVGEVILGVGYCDLNILALVILKHLHLTKKRYHFWTEANYLTLGARKSNRFKQALRKFVFSCVDGNFIFPGKMSVLSFEKWGIPYQHYILLPNVIDEGSLKYVKTEKDINRKPVFLIPARLVEYIKGIINFFEAIGDINIRKAQFIIAGDGPDYNIYKDFIAKHNLQDNIELKGFCNAETLSGLYNNADALILPSFTDQSPLTLVEALRFHLPILCSSYCGNHFEAVVEGVNGYTFSPYEKKDIRFKFEELMNNQNKWDRMGEESAHIFDRVFKSSNVVENFINKMKINDN